MLVVVALGGNALLRRGEPMTMEVQRRNAQGAAAAIAELARAHSVVVTHGNGPQVGLLALESEGHDPAHPAPLDVLGAESQGMVGYLLESALRNAMPGCEVATLLTQVAVDGDDPAFAAPAKPIGPVYGEAEARQLAEARGWAVAADGDRYRRVVASPEPRRILEVAALQALVEDGVLVIAAGGGGVPVVIDADGQERGVEAVVDKDLTADLLARELRADALLLLTDVSSVLDGWPAAGARAIRTAPVEWLRGQGFAPGSMGPKAEAACRFVERSGGLAAIGALADAAAVFNGEAGTGVLSAGATRYWP